MKIYKFLRGLLKASALTTVMFIMQACYGTPNGPVEMEARSEEDVVTVENDTIQPQIQEEAVADMQVGSK